MRKRLTDRVHAWWREWDVLVSLIGVLVATVICWGLAILAFVGLASLLASCSPAHQVALASAAKSSEVVMGDGADCVAQAGNLTLISELAVRGLHLEQVRRVRATWSPPETGSPVVYYRMWTEQIGANDTLTRVTIAGSDTSVIVVSPAYIDSLRASVAGVDAQGRQGPRSEWSDWYVHDPY